MFSKVTLFAFQLKTTVVWAKTTSLLLINANLLEKCALYVWKNVLGCSLDIILRRLHPKALSCANYEKMRLHTCIKKFD